MKAASIVGLGMALMLLMIMSGCGGGGDGGIVPTTGGSVAGRVVTGLQTPQGIGNITIKVMNGATVVAQGTSDANGNFLISGIPAGTYTLAVEIPPALGLVLAPGTQLPQVTIVTGQVTNLPAPILLIDAQDQPPLPPS